jgi:hypothetical protein
MLAQLDTVNASTLKDVLLIGSAAITIAGALVLLLRKPRMAIDPQPLVMKPAPEFVSRDQCAIAHESLKAQLDRHESQIISIWQTIRDENTAIRAEIARGFKQNDFQLGLIEGELKRLRT